ncbi:MAG TPA: F420-nonreducing hydrogenase [Syntrophobacteraceae bacterium]|nr:F420-nonreducing hydrogenase [Syntrophobacteraceae bacterium]
MRLSYPPNVKIVKLPCSGRAEIIHLMQALEEGADGVMVAGCLEGDCHYQVGNIRARKRVAYVKEILEKVGVGAERITMYNLSAGQGPRFAEIAREMTEKIRKLGPSPIRIAKQKSAEAGAKEAA